MVIAVRTILVTVLKLLHVFSEALLALFARERHLERLLQLMLLRLGVALRAIKPLFAAWGPNRNLSVENVLASRA